MSHELDFSTGKAAIAFIGSRDDIWHKLGQEMQAGMSIEQWAENAGLNFRVELVPALAALEGDAFSHIAPEHRLRRVPDRFFGVRSDTGAPLGYVSDVYQVVQPRDVLNWFDQYISVDDRFQLDVAGALKGGSLIWATATFRESMSVAGDNHVARLLMSTTFDGSGSTTNRACMTRVVCNNTLQAAFGEKAKAIVKTRHNTRFNPERVGRELAKVAEGFSQYKAVGDALATHHMAKSEVADFFKDLLEIPRQATADDISTRKANQFLSLGDAYATTLRECGNEESAWAALNAVTRYVDHDKATRGGENENEARLLSSQFGSGQAMKEQAMGLLMPLIKDRVPVLA